MHEGASTRSRLCTHGHSGSTRAACSPWCSGWAAPRRITAARALLSCYSSTATNGFFSSCTVSTGLGPAGAPRAARDRRPCVVRTDSRRDRAERATKRGSVGARSGSFSARPRASLPRCPLSGLAARPRSALLKPALAAPRPVLFSAVGCSAVGRQQKDVRRTRCLGRRSPLPPPLCCLPLRRCPALFSALKRPLRRPPRPLRRPVRPLRRRRPLRRPPRQLQKRLMPTAPSSRYTQ